MTNGTFSVIGGDKRCAYAAQLLIDDKYNVKTAGLELSGLIDAPYINTLDEAITEADYIILPLPLLDKEGRMFSVYSKNKLDVYAVIKSARPETMIFAGRIPGAVSAFSKEYDKELYDYYIREELQIMNAVPTAEGTVEALMRQLPVTLFDSHMLVTGFGRTAQALCLLLKAMGVHVTVAARKPQAIAQAKSTGCHAIAMSQIPNKALEYDAVVNTVPARIITAPVLDAVRPDCFVLDIASAPGGVDVAYAQKIGIAVESALSLPGKVAPKTAGKIIKDTVLNIIEERGHGD